MGDAEMGNCMCGGRNLMEYCKFTMMCSLRSKRQRQIGLEIIDSRWRMLREKILGMGLEKDDLGHPQVL